jgi:hypothetical protein
MVLLRWAQPVFFLSIFYFSTWEMLFFYFLWSREAVSYRYGSRVGGREGRGASVGGVDPRIFLIRNMIY